MVKVKIELTYQEVCDVAMALKHAYNDEEHYIQMFEFNDALKESIRLARKQANRYDDLHTKFLEFIRGHVK